MLFLFKSAKKYNKRTELILILKVGPLGKGQLKISTEKRHLFPVKDRVNLDTKVGPLGKGQLKIDRKETFVSSGVIL